MGSASKLTVAAALAAACLWAGAARALTVGDVQIIGYSAADINDTPNSDAFSFVTWVDLAAGAKLTFTDIGINPGPPESFSSFGETVVVWENTTAATVTAGTVIVVTTADGADLGTISSVPDLGTTGDQLFVLDGNASADINAGTKLYGIQMNGTWDDATSGTTNSGLPGSLDSPDGNIFFSPEVDAAAYAGVRTGLTVAGYKALLGSPGNYSTSDDPLALDSTDFAIIPAPSSLALLGLGGLAMLARRRVG